MVLLVDHREHHYSVCKADATCILLDDEFCMCVVVLVLVVGLVVVVAVVVVVVVVLLFFAHRRLLFRTTLRVKQHKGPPHSHPPTHPAKRNRQHNRRKSEPMRSLLRRRACERMRAGRFVRHVVVCVLTCMPVYTT